MAARAGYSDSLSGVLCHNGQMFAEPSAATERTFANLLVNTLVTTVTGTFVWWAFIFWAYLETRSVLITGVVGAAYMAIMAAASPIFGTLVDHRGALHSIRLVTAISVVMFALAGATFVIADESDLLDLGHPLFWVFLVLLLAGSVAAALRSIAVSTCVTMLVRADRRDRANGLVGTVSGISFALTSVFSGLAIGMLSMAWSIAITVVLTTVAAAHLLTIRFVEPDRTAAEGERRPKVDFRGAIEAIREVPGLGLLIALSTFNNLLGGVMFALMDAYGLTLMSVEAWGILWAVLSFGFIAGGLIVAKFGLGAIPIRTLILANLAGWMICAVFTLRSSVALLAVGMWFWMVLGPIAEACEQTILQRAIPLERQGRVFGFAQFVETAAAPVTSLSIAPIAERFFIPTMTDGRGADAIGSWFGVGPERGIALVFTLAGVLGFVCTLAVRASKTYERLAAAESAEPTDGPSGGAEIAAIAPA